MVCTDEILRFERVFVFDVIYTFSEHLLFPKCSRSIVSLIPPNRQVALVPVLMSKLGLVSN